MPSSDKQRPSLKNKPAEKKQDHNTKAREVQGTDIAQAKIQALQAMSRVKPTTGQRAADWTTKWVGSWTFISLLFVVMAIWMLLNLYLAATARWDPYPFILLNFVLSCLAAVQAPIILMSQNRAADRDRIKAERDYAVNRKAEREVEEVKQQLETIRNYLYKKFN
jgi:uncharacterized membrane protein